MTDPQLEAWVQELTSLINDEERRAQSRMEEVTDQFKDLPDQISLNRNPRDLFGMI